MTKTQKIVALCSAIAAALTLAGCSLDAPGSAKASETEHVPQKKIFAPGKHCFTTYYELRDNEGYHSPFRVQVKMPEGYEKTDAEFTTNAYGASIGVTYWWTNTETVEATEAKNSHGDWDYCYPGQVIEQEKILVIQP